MMARASIFRALSRQRNAAEALGLNSCTSAFAQGNLRHLNIFTVFSKEAREKERARLKDEMNRGYFDDLREFNKHGGKVGFASKNLVPVLAAGKFPSLMTYTSSNDPVSLPITENQAESKNVTVIGLVFRASAQNLLESWTKTLLSEFQSSANIELIQISVVDSWFLSLPPMKRILLRIMKQPGLVDGEDSLKRRVVYAFGDTYYFRRELGIPNVLSGYLFLLDKEGRVRWRANGLATAEELSSMNSCISRLLEQGAQSEEEEMQALPTV